MSDVASSTSLKLFLPSPFPLDLTPRIPEGCKTPEDHNVYSKNSEAGYHSDINKLPLNSSICLTSMSRSAHPIPETLARSGTHKSVSEVSTAPHCETESKTELDDAVSDTCTLSASGPQHNARLQQHPSTTSTITDTAKSKHNQSAALSISSASSVQTNDLVDKSDPVNESVCLPEPGAVQTTADYRASTDHRDNTDYRPSTDYLDNASYRPSTDYHANTDYRDNADYRADTGYHVRLPPLDAQPQNDQQTYCNNICNLAGTMLTICVMTGVITAVTI